MNYIIEKLKQEIPKLAKFGDYTIYGITHLDIKMNDSCAKQIVLIFERLRVEEPCVFLTQNQIYADVYVEIDDNVLSGEIKEELFKFENAKLRKPFSFQKDIASKDICIDEALKKRLFKAYGDKEVWKFQLDALRKVLNSPQWTFPSRLIKEFQEEPIVDDDHSERIEYCKLPQMELHNIPSEFKNITEHFKSLRKKYVAKQF